MKIMDFFNEENKKDGDRKCYRSGNIVFVKCDGKFFVSINDNLVEINEIIFKECMRMEYGIQNNERKHKHVLSLDMYECSDHYEYVCLSKHKSFENAIIDTINIKEAITAASNQKNGLSIIKRVLQGYSDTEIGKELGISRQSVEYRKKKMLEAMKEVLEND